MGIQQLLMAGGAGWSPRQMVAPPKLWLDPMSDVTDVSGAASQWSDRSGNDWHALQSTAANQPAIINGAINGLRALSFDGTNDRLQTSASGAQTLYRNVSTGWALGVFKRAATGTATRVVFGASTGNESGRSRFRFDIASDKLRLAQLRDDGTTPLTLSGATSIDTNWHMALMLMDWSTAAGSIYLDGSLDGSATSFGTTGTTANTSSLNPLTIGSNMNGTEAYLDGRVASILAGSGAALPSTDEINRLFGWVAWFYGLQGDLPVGHPYKTTPP